MEPGAPNDEVGTMPGAPDTGIIPGELFIIGLPVVIIPGTGFIPDTVLDMGTAPLCNGGAPTWKR